MRTDRLGYGSQEYLDQLNASRTRRDVEWARAADGSLYLRYTAKPAAKAR